MVRYWCWGSVEEEEEEEEEGRGDHQIPKAIENSLLGFLPAHNFNIDKILKNIEVLPGNSHVLSPKGVFFH